MAFDWRWAGLATALSALWGSLPSSLQDFIKNKAWGIVIGTVVMMAYFAYEAFLAVRQMPRQVVALIGFLFFVGGFTLWNQYQWRQLQQVMRANIERGAVPRRRLPDATPGQLAQSRITGVRFHLADLVRDGPILESKVIEDCQIVGPAVVALMGDNRIEGNELDGGRPLFSDYVWVVPEGHSLVGVLGLKKCRLKGNHFLHIAFIATEQQAAEWQKETSFRRRPES